MKRPPVEILHAHESGRDYWIQLRYHRDHEAEALAAADRRARSAAWDPERVRTETTSETKNWRTVERWYERPLTLTQLVALSAEDLDDEQGLVPFSGEKIRQMVARREEFNAEKNPLFAAMGALEEVASTPNPLRYLLDHSNQHMRHVVSDAAARQEAYRARRQVEAILGPEAVAELEVHYTRIYPAHYVPGRWSHTLKDPVGELLAVRELEELRRQPAITLVRCVRASCAGLYHRYGSERFEALKAEAAALAGDEAAELEFWRLHRDAEIERRHAEKRAKEAQSGVSWRVAS